MANTTRSPLINRWTNDILNREKDTGLTAYAVGKVFSGASLPQNINLDTVTQVGIWRVIHPSINQINIPTISDITGFLQVMDINRDEEENALYKGVRRIRQIIYPDKADESSPYTRVGESSTVNGTIAWSDWSMMGGGSLRRVVATSNVTTALNNVMYEVFTDGLTITLPAASSVPIGTQIGVEQYIGSGKVLCGDLEQVTECDIAFYEPSDVTHPNMVTRWTHNPNTPNVVYAQTLNISGGSGVDDPTSFAVTGSGDIDGTFVLMDSSKTGQARVWKNGYVYSFYDEDEQIWKFVRSDDNFATITSVIYQAEYSFKSADALCYVFEVVIGEDGGREWVLDVDNNFAKAVDILSERITGAYDEISDINEKEPYLHFLRTRTTKNITNPSENQLICNKPADGSTLEEQIAVLKSNDYNVYFYDFIVSVTSTRTIKLPTTNVPRGAVVCIEVVGACSATVVAGEYSDTYTGTSNEILICEFEYTQIGANSYAWTILSLA